MDIKANDYLLNQDSLIGMKQIPDASIDLVLTDPPYGIANNAKLTKVGSKIVTTNQAWGEDFQDEWETMEDYWNWLKPYIAEFHRVMKDSGSIILFLDRKYTGLIAYLMETEFSLNFQNKIYFEKVNPLPSFRKNNYRSCLEEAIWFSKGKQKCFNFGEQADMKQIYKGPIGKKATKHGCEKYGWMIEPLIKNHSKPGDIVLDAFAGSGSTIVHALKHQRKAIGFEKNPEFFDMAKNRCQHEQLELCFE
ncbi:TPA: site-specific DNA-methyltransferase [Burkholderia cepacia]|uniref:Methyltransferase n=1 Tax=Burkholderia cenocepacia TaxID=95486 RepID=A0ABD4UCS7_9BURK|nr:MULTISPECIES: site-specific DNA-methyltransferase [Burkholderia]HDR9763697.1 site-specific DNA-methyltransferase [Burkholderia cepacia ATCC 25416]MCA8361281.1 site-specific DNA-methyltransferase [Burkholderia cepacia]MCW3498740.1 site-specific DNA-methyltransferase [Burkholderia cenocepacia]MCW3506172.1 site-specific DNA-methyltransferase [Burkholderia cenocepacia]MCW3513893.1 site-specific DNA-methyltransferase [Burkholderia cenocepacia]